MRSRALDDALSPRPPYSACNFFPHVAVSIAAPGVHLFPRPCDLPSPHSVLFIVLFLFVRFAPHAQMVPPTCGASYSLGLTLALTLPVGVVGVRTVSLMASSSLSFVVSAALSSPGFLPKTREAP